MSLRPQGWATATIAELVAKDGVFVDGDWVESKDQDPNGDIRLVQLADIGVGKFLDKSSRFLTSEKARELRCTFLAAGDVLVARMPDPLGRACRFPGDTGPCVTVVDVCIVRTGTGGPDHKWLMWFLNAPDTMAAVASLQSGSTRKRISRSNLATIRIPVPPRPEQVRIVAEIEKQFTRLDDAVAALKRVQANLKRYRASVLKAACEGRLVPTEAELAHKEGRSYEPASELLKRILSERRAKWEAGQLQKMIAAGKPPKDDAWKHRYDEPQRPNTTTFPELPKGWAWATIDEISECLDGKRVPVNKDERAQREGEIPYYGANGRVGWIDEFLFDEPLVLVVEDETFVGRTIPFSYLITGKSWVNNHAHVLRPSAAVLPEYLNYSLMFYPFTPLTTGSTGRRKLTQKALMAAPFPLPPKDEQIRIVSAVERLTSMVDNVISTAEVGHKRAAVLRQRVLSTAFSGKLVSQDPSDEPASALLERIRAERTRAEAQKQKTATATNGDSPANGQRRKPGPPTRAGVARGGVGRCVKELAQGVSPGKG